MLSFDKHYWEKYIFQSKFNNIHENNARILKNGIHIFELDFYNKITKCTVGYNHLEYPLCIKLHFI